MKSQASDNIVSLTSKLENLFRNDILKRVEAQNTFCKLWNCLTHTMRKSLAIEIFKKESAGDKWLENAYGFYTALDLDSKAELYSFISDTQLEEFF